MAGFREEAAETVWVLSKILKPKIPQGGRVNLSFLANTKVQMYPLQKSSAFYNIVRKLTFSHSESWLVGHWLQQTASGIINGLAEKPSRPISLYILTDGKFGDQLPEFDTPIKTLHRLMETQHIMPSFFSLTIIQFGNDPGASDALRYIQNSVSSLENVAFNPVHICPWDGDVGEMLIGRIRDSSTNLSAVARPHTAGIPRG